MARPRFKTSGIYNYHITSTYLLKQIDTWGLWPLNDQDRKDTAIATLVNQMYGHKCSKLPSLYCNTDEQGAQEAFDQINRFMEEYLDDGQLRKLHLVIRQKRKGKKDDPCKDVKVAANRDTHSLCVRGGL